MIDPENAIDEDNEDDNVYELTVEWLASAPAAPEPTTYTDEELTALFDGFTALLDDPRPVLGADPSAAGVEHEPAGADDFASHLCKHVGRGGVRRVVF